MRKKVEFVNKSNFQLSGIVELPDDGEPRAFALFAHCFTCNKNLKAVNNISRSLVNNGIGVLRFDFTGLGESEGDFSDTNFSSNLDDIYAACSYLETHYLPVSIMIGHSLGGAAVLNTAGEINSCKAVVTIASPSSPDHVLKHISQDIDAIEKQGSSEVLIGGRKFNIKKQFVEDLSGQKINSKIRNLNKPLLIFHAPFDDIVGIDNASEIFMAAKHPKSFISLDKADHLLSDSDDSQYVGSVIASWADKYVQKSSDNNIDLSDYQVGARTYNEGYFTDITTSNHSLVSDEPVSYGGTDKGPTPYELLLAALGSCTNITLRMYANRKKIALEKITTLLKYDKVHLEDCEDCEDSDKKVDFIEKEIDLIGDLSEKERSRLLEIADKCPVHKTLKSKVHISTKTK